MSAPSRRFARGAGRRRRSRATRVTALVGVVVLVLVGGLVTRRRLTT